MPDFQSSGNLTLSQRKSTPRARAQGWGSRFFHILNNSTYIVLRAPPRKGGVGCNPGQVRLVSRVRVVVVRSGDAPIKVQQDRKKLMEGHFNISITKRVSLENSTDLGRGAAPELKSVEFLSETLLVVEQIDIHTNFTARQMLYLYRSITQVGREVNTFSKG